MALGRDKDELSVMEAVNNLSNMSEIDVKAPFEEGEEVISEEIDWSDPRQALQNEDLVKETFRVLHRYLQNMVRKDQNSLKDPQTQRGVQAIMLLASEAAAKMDKFSALHSKGVKISKLKEYTDLQKYYRQHILRQMPKPKEEGEEWEAAAYEELEGVEAEKKGLQDLEGVRKDLNYELFFIKGENGKPFFSRGLLRHIRLVGNFDELVSKVEGEDPLLAVRELFDREILEGAKESLKALAPYVDLFYKEGMKHKDLPFVGNLNKAVMALRMAANSVNLIENQSFKSCLEYYADFHRFLRDAMKAPGYRKRISGEMEEDEFSHSLLNLTHALCCYFYMRTQPLKEALKLVHKIIDRGDEMRGPRPKEKADTKGLEVWLDLQDKDESIRYLLNHYPNGPILRTLDAFREEEEFEGWDPLTHYNFPSQQFTFSAEQLHISVLHLPCPVVQKEIHRAEVTADFIGFLRFYKSELKPDKHLMVNLQNRTSWEDFARCRAIEETSARAEHHDTFHILGLPKDLPFYHQDEEYAQMGGAPVFMESFKEQILGGIECGFFLPEQIKKAPLEKFIDRAFKVIHEHFFEKQKSLSRAERLNFIEIFYALYITKILDLMQIDSVSFTCKDALDVGAAQTALYYGFTLMLSSKKPWTKQEIDHLLWMAYGPALLVRDRGIHQTRWKRALMALECIHKACLSDHDAFVKGINSLFDIVKFPIKL
ncbi:MAG: hypothetical protein P0S96_04515 [Simkaniaceae bacterium]|nr:hypothetical protein [Candidatus Sacchlamyda saccharinae]